MRAAVCLIAGFTGASMALAHPQNSTVRPLTQVVWTCKVPCESDSGAPLGAFAYNICAKDVGSPDFFAAATPGCRAEYHDPLARAVGWAGGDVIGLECETSGNPCEKAGPVPVTYHCMALCGPTEAPARSYAVCAYEAHEAWAAATQLCDHPIKPPETPEAQICVPDGQTPCTLSNP